VESILGFSRPEWPSPRDCTSSVSDELVLIQWLNLVQSQRLRHTFFFGPPLRIFFFFTCGPRLLTQVPFSKKVFPPTLLLCLCYEFFLNALFFFVVIVNVITHCHHYVHRRSRNWHNLKVWATQGAIFWKGHQNKVFLLQFFLHLWFLHIFNLGLSLWDLCFDCFQSSSTLRRSFVEWLCLV
jgi:hypothetical protein